MNQLAPIVLFVYNRLNHVRKTVEALKRNTLASQSELIVYCDGAVNHTEDEERVRQVRAYVDGISGFSRVEVKRQTKNLGLAESILGGVSEVLESYGCAIILEDDLVSSPYFLQFMNEALEMYRDDKRVACIHAYTFPLEMELPESFFLNRVYCWGWATWKDRWEGFNSDGVELLEEIRRKNLTYEFDQCGTMAFTQMLVHQTQGKNNSWAIRWRAYNFLNQNLCLFPGRSLIDNRGMNSSGTHCSNDDSFYQTRLSETPVRLERIPVEENPDIERSLQLFFKKNIRQKLRQKLKWLYLRLVARLKN